MTFLLWYTIVASVLGLGFWYVSRRLIRPAALSRRGKIIARIALALLLILPIASAMLVRAGRDAWTDPLAWLGYTGLGFLSFLFTFLLIRDILWMLIALPKKIRALARRLRGGTNVGAAPVDEQRRLVLVNGMNLGILGLATSFTGYGIFEARRRPAVLTIDVPVPSLPAGLEGFRIVQITDIHAGLTVRKDFVETIAAMVQELGGDAIALTGDLADGSVAQLRDDVSPLASLTAPSGKFFVTGNHEYYSGVEPWVEEADRLGFAVLLNEHRVVQRNGASILLAGVTDHSGGRFLPGHQSDPARALEHAPPCDVRILLAHQPVSLLAALPFGFDLQISGHTHGGQFFPWNLLATFGQPYISGLHLHQGTHIYVSRGTGYWGPPVRLAARAEVTVLRLTATKG